MIPNFQDIGTTNIFFVLFASVLVLLSWSRWNRAFLSVFVVFSCVIVASWLTIASAIALSLFLVVPYVIARAIWGRGAGGTSLMVLGVAWELIAFIYLRQYDWGAELSILNHSVFIIGLSFILFRVIQLMIDAPIMRNISLTPHYYVGFVLAMWTLLAGPIQKYDAFVAGMKNLAAPDRAESLSASHRIINGLFKTFIISPVFLDASSPGRLLNVDRTWFDVLLVFYSYPIYLYLNFSGYTDAMIGISRLCGFKGLPENFDRPWLACNIQEFWARWHISLGTWIRAYLFTPLMRSLLSRFGSRHQAALAAGAILITFILIGLWHGITVGFFIFGLLHGLGYLAGVWWGRWRQSRLGRDEYARLAVNPLSRFTARTLCFHFVCLTLNLAYNDFGILRSVLESFIA